MGQLDRTSPVAHVLQKGAIILGDSNMDEK